MSSFNPTKEQVEFLVKIYPVSRETMERLVTYHEVLSRWQTKTNLVAPSTLDSFWERHVADSLQVMRIVGDSRYITDIGSGGGFPGMVLAILLHQISLDEGADTKVNLIESIQKKCSFLRQVAIATNIEANVFPIRIENAKEHLLSAEIITARALASLEKLLEFTDGCLVGERRAIFHKGRDYQREIQDCHGKWTFDLIVHTSQVDDDSVLLEISNAVRL